MDSRKSIAYAEEQVTQDPYDLPLNEIDVANPFLFGHKISYRRLVFIQYWTNSTIIITIHYNILS